MQLKHENTHVNSAQIILILSNLHVENVPDSTVRSYIKIVIHIQQRPYLQSKSSNEEVIDGETLNGLVVVE